MHNTALRTGTKGATLAWGSLADLMRSAGYDEQSLADSLNQHKCKVTTRTVRAWLMGERTPTTATLKVVAKVLNTDLSLLLKENSEICLT